jgi:hypothetical protein
MDAIARLDRHLARALGRPLRDGSRRLGVNLHTAAFWACGAFYVVIWRLLCQVENHPDWMWFLLGPGLGSVASFLADNDAVALLDEGLGLTRIGADARWALLRLTYVPLGLVLVAQVAADGGHGAAFCFWLTAEVGLFGLLEYLLAIRLVADDHPLMVMLREMMRAAAGTDESPKAPEAPAEAGG